MTLKEEQKDSNQESQVSRFFTGKSILVTGAAGFLGVVLLENLLRCCPDIRLIYILLRPKKGVLPEDRKEEIFKRGIFCKIKEKNPDALDKVQVISGDVSKKNLGMSEIDLLKVTKDVTIVFHCAAAISFLKPLRFLLEQNVLGTFHIIEFCQTLRKVDALVYTSTAFSNCNRKEPIEEKIYEMPFTARKALELLKKDSDEDLESLFNSCEPKFPNFYTFSKCIAENLLKETASAIPVTIVRPAIIGNCWKGILPGYIQEGSGMVNICLGVGKGFIRVLPMDEGKRVEYIPVDVAANTHVIAAWCQGTERFCSPRVYNCTTGLLIDVKWGDLVYQMSSLGRKYPLPDAIGKPCVRIYKNSVMYWFMSIIEHYIPALILDALLLVTARKPRLFNLYRFYDKVMKCLGPFTFNEWELKCENFESLTNELNSTDSEMFYVDLKGHTFVELITDIPTGAPFYKGTTDKRMRTLSFFSISWIKWISLGSIILCLFWPWRLVLNWFPLNLPRWTHLGSL